MSCMHVGTTTATSTQATCSPRKLLSRCHEGDDATSPIAVVALNNRSPFQFMNYSNRQLLLIDQIRRSVFQTTDSFVCDWMLHPSKPNQHSCSPSGLQSTSSSIGPCRPIEFQDAGVPDPFPTRTRTATTRSPGFFAQLKDLNV